MTGRIAMIGFGEAATAFVSGRALGDPARITDHHAKFAQPSQAQAMAAGQAAHGVRGAAGMAGALAGAGLISCLVTADCAIEAAGAHCIDMAIMAPVHPKKHLVPIRLAAPKAEAAALALRGLDMRPEVVGDRVGAALSVKMLRAVMIKGLEASDPDIARLDRVAAPL